MCTAWRCVGTSARDGNDRMGVELNGAGGMDGVRNHRLVCLETLPDLEAPNVITRPLARGGSTYSADGAEPRP